MFYVYKLSNLINNKIYIGQTNNPNQRWAQHKSAVKHKTGTLLVTRAMTKHGIDNFSFEVIAMAKTQDLINELEVLLIDQYNALDKTIGYNLDKGGGHCERTPEVCAKISAGLNEFYKNNVSIAKGRPLSEEHKKNISTASFGKPGTNLGKTFSDEWRAKLSKSMEGIPNLKLRKFSLETEKNMCDLYLSGKSMYRIAKIFETRRDLIKSILNRNSVEIRKSNYNKHRSCRHLFTIEQELEICEYFKNNKISRRSLAKKYNCGSTTIREILYKHKAITIKDNK